MLCVGWGQARERQTDRGAEGQTETEKTKTHTHTHSELQAHTKINFTSSLRCHSPRFLRQGLSKA